MFIVIMTTVIMMKVMTMVVIAITVTAITKIDNKNHKKNWTISVKFKANEIDI